MPAPTIRASASAGGFFWLARAIRLSRYSPGELLGGVFFADPRHPGAETAGFLLMVLLGSTLLPVVYAVVLRALGAVTWWSGLILGGVHGLLAAAALPLIGMISASVRAGRIPGPGPFGSDWGAATPVVLVIGHILYGALFGAILASS